MYQSLERRLENLSKEGRTPEELVLQLLEDEKQHRKNVATKTLETRAKFRRESLLENWDSSFERGVSKSKIRDLATLGFWNLKKNLIIVGSTGSGKTQLSIAIGRSACQLGLECPFCICSAVIGRSSGRKGGWKVPEVGPQDSEIRCFNPR
jgi:DNA replication protein DnaC